MRQAVKRGKMMAEINITPFTDVVLVLLIIFMVTTPMLMQSAIKIKLPKVSSSETEADRSIKIKITDGGMVYMNEKKIGWDALKDRLSAKLANDPGLVVIIDADRSVQYDQVVKVLDISKKSGAKKLALGVVNERNEGE